MRTVRVVAAVIRDHERIFAAARGYGPQKGGWEFPGGKIEPGESPQEALVREIQEELDTKIEAGEWIKTLEYDYPDFHLSMDCFWCRITDGKLTPLEGQDTRWLTKDTLYSVSWLPADLELIPIIAAALEKETEPVKIRGAIFDVDGVLLDSLSIWKNLGERYLAKFNETAEPGLSGKLFPLSLEEGAEYLQKQYKLNKTVEEICRGLQEMIQNFYYYEVKSKTGAAELLDRLQQKGFRIQAATSGPKDHVEKALKRNGLMYYIEKIRTTTEIGESKQSPCIFYAIAADMNLPPEEIIVFEDTLYALQTAKKAGFHVAGIYDPYGESEQEKLEAESEVYLKSFAELSASCSPAEVKGLQGI